MKKIVSFLALAGSLGTLVCCFLPAVFVTLGFGAAFAGIVGNFPQLIWISAHKRGVFLVAGILILTAAILNWQARRLSCPPDPALAEACKSGRDWSKWMLAGALIAFFVGSFFAFILPRLVTA